MRTLPLSRGLVALVDDEDYALASKYKWSLRVNGGGNRYATHTFGDKPVLLHRFIMEAPWDSAIDHINGDGLDCRRSNLRFATHVQNMGNRAKPKVGFGGLPPTSRYKGVSLARRRRGRLVWHLRIEHAGTVFQRDFKTEREAALAYNAKALEFWGAYARLNEVS